MIWWPQAARFPRVESRRRARAFVLGLLAELLRKNCWTIAGHAGDASPGGMPARSAMTSAATSPHTLATRRRCW
jgi:hypothetical protein